MGSGRGSEAEHSNWTCILPLHLGFIGVVSDAFWGYVACWTVAIESLTSSCWSTYFFDLHLCVALARPQCWLLMDKQKHKTSPAVGFQDVPRHPWLYESRFNRIRTSSSLVHLGMLYPSRPGPALVPFQFKLRAAAGEAKAPSGASRIERRSRGSEG